jgi:hypothetical protein
MAAGAAVGCDWFWFRKKCLHGYACRRECRDCLVIIRAELRVEIRRLAEKSRETTRRIRGLR